MEGATTARLPKVDFDIGMCLSGKCEEGGRGEEENTDLFKNYPFLVDFMSTKPYTALFLEQVKAYLTHQLGHAIFICPLANLRMSFKSAGQIQALAHSLHLTLVMLLSI